MKAERIADSIFVKRSFVLDSLSTFLGTAVTMMLTIPVGIAIARVLGPDGKGTVTLASLVIGQAAFALSLGVEVALIHHAGKKSYDLPALASASLSLSLLLGACGFVVAVGILSFVLDRIVPSTVLSLAPVLASAIPFVLAATFLRSLLRVSGRVVEEGIVGAGGALLDLVAVMTALAGGFGYVGVLIGLTLSSVLLSLVVLIMLRHYRILSLPPTFAPAIWKSLVSYGLRLHVGSVLQALNYRFDLYLVALFLGASSAGLYSVAVAVAEWLWVLPNVLGTLIMQRVATRSESEANALMGPLNRLTSGALVAGCVVWIFLGRQLIRGLYGQAFVESSRALLWLLPGIWALGLWKNLMNDLSVRGYPTFKSYTAGVAVLFTIVLDVTLIPRWGIVGAAAASSIAYVSALVTTLWVSSRVIPYAPVELVLPRIADFRLVFAKISATL